MTFKTALRRDVFIWIVNGLLIYSVLWVCELELLSAEWWTAAAPRPENRLTANWVDSKPLYMEACGMNRAAQALGRLARGITKGGR